MKVYHTLKCLKTRTCTCFLSNFLSPQLSYSFPDERQTQSTQSEVIANSAVYIAADATVMGVIKWYTRHLVLKAHLMNLTKL